MLSQGQIFIDRVVLRADSDLFENVHDASVDLLAEELDAAWSFGNGCCDDVERGGFACPVGAKQSENLSLAYVETVVSDG